MRLHPLPILLAALALAATAASSAQFAVSGHLRQYDAHREFEDRPFAKNDMGYGLAFELRDDMGYWQLGALYTPNPGRGHDLDFAATPFLNMVLRDRLFLIGLGIRSTYVKGPDSEDDWSDLYWNILTGLDFPLGRRFSLSAMAYYDFEKWSRMKDFDFSDVEYGAALNLLF